MAKNNDRTSNHPLQACAWCNSDPLLLKYHDQEWGTPLFDNLKLFEFIILEGAQAGLNWLTILKRRENYRRALDNFNPQIMASYTPEKVQQLMENAGIIRNRLKIASTIKNAQAYLKLSEQQNFAEYLWQFVDGKPINNKLQRNTAHPVVNQQSQQLSKDLKQRGFTFVGPVICYAFMQAVGMINDHVVDCYRYQEILNYG